MAALLDNQHDRGGHGAVNNAHPQRIRRLVWHSLQRRLQEATSSDGDDVVDHMIHHWFHQAVVLHRVANAMGLDFESIVSSYQEEAHGGGFGAVPASAAVVAELEKQTFRATAEGCGGGTECAICLEGFEDGEELSMMPCSHGHGFHSDCITKWLGRSNMCPLCRHQLPTGHGR